MLEQMDLTKNIDKKTYKRRVKESVQKLGLLQRECRKAGIPIVIVFEGMGASGKGMQINRLIQALDPRGFHVYACNPSTREEKLYPFLWRYWTKTPARGQIAIFDRSWYRMVQVDRFDGLTSEDRLSDGYQDILSFEKQLSDDGTVIIKFFLYIDKKEQKKRFRKLEASRETCWRVTKRDWKRNREFHRYLQINEEMLERTDTDSAPWSIIEGVNADYGTLKIITCVIRRLEYELEVRKGAAEGNAHSEGLDVRGEFKHGVLSGIDLSRSMSGELYRENLKKYQKRLKSLHSQIHRLGIPVVIGFEGWDAGGKGGAIKRLTSHLDPRGYQVNPIAAPNDTEKAHHYLWRFWKDMPKAGTMAIFDRTWYGRVLVERVEGFCSQGEWRRAYQEINEMESHMVNAGTVVLKFWLHIDKEEQERRFKKRQSDPMKQWKITEEDWRNREKWELYEEAVNEMLIRTSTTYVPWIVVEGNDKNYARIKVMRSVVEALEKKIKEVKMKHE